MLRVISLLSCAFFISVGIGQQREVVTTSIPIYNHFRTVFTSGSSVFQQYKKVEIGIELPTEIQQQVEEFVNTDGEMGINPYLEWKLSVKVIFTHLETNEKDTIDAFYYQQLEPFNNYDGDNLPRPRNGIGYSVAEYKNLGGWNKIDTPYSFMARFVAMKAGEWNYKVELASEKMNFNYPVESFYVEESKENPFIGISPTKRYVSRSGEAFYPIGCNVQWPQTDSASDSIFANLNKYLDADGEPHLISEAYRNLTVAPRVYDKFNDKLLELVKNGANWLRIIMAPQSYDIEFEKLGNYTDRLNQAYELDRLLDLAESNNFYVQWCMAIHYTFNVEPYSITQWDWDEAKGENVFAYKKEFGLINPIDFFKSEDAKKYYRQRIRYILSRWGYSGNIGLFEIVSEIDNITYEVEDKDSEYEEVICYLESWQNEMANYIKQNYFGRIHLLSGSYAGTKPEQDRGYFEVDAYDVMGSNIYQYGGQSLARFWPLFVGEDVLDQSTGALKSNYTVECEDDSCDYVVKPLVLSESEAISIRHKLPNSQIDLIRHIWQSLFSGVAYDLPWTLGYRKQDYYVFVQIRSFYNSIGFKDDNWHPWYMNTELYDGNLLWKLDKNYRDKLKSVANSKSDIIYMRRNDLTQAIGVITNKTINIESYEGYSLEDFTPQFRKAKKVNINSEKMKVDGLIDNHFVINYYYLTDFSQPVFTQKAKSKNGQIQLKKAKLGKDKDSFILVFTVEPEVLTIK